MVASDLRSIGQAAARRRRPAVRHPGRGAATDAVHRGPTDLVPVAAASYARAGQLHARPFGPRRLVRSLLLGQDTDVLTANPQRPPG